MTVDDLESAGGESVLEAWHTYDEKSGVSFAAHARIVIRRAMLDEIRTVKHSRAKTQVVELQPTDRHGNDTPLPADPRSPDPRLVAEAREVLDRPRVSVSHAQSVLPAPSVVSAQVAALRDAMFCAVRPDDVAAVMGSLVERAKGGDVKAAKLIIDLLKPPAQRINVHQQQAVVINRNDVG